MTVVAIAYNDDGTEHDRLFTWETGVNYSNIGYRVVAVADDGWATVALAQEIYDAERAAAADCFGPGIRY
jgi:hypothetical protein